MTHLWVIQIWIIPHSKANTRIWLKWEYHIELTTWWRSRANWKKYIISLYSATTWVDRFDFFTEYRLRHVWLMYDVTCHDSYIMTHKLWVINSRIFLFPRFFGDFTLLESEKRANKYKFFFRYYDSLYESYIYESYLVLKQTVWSTIKLKKNWRLTTW